MDIRWALQLIQTLRRVVSTKDAWRWFAMQWQPCAANHLEVQQRIAIARAHKCVRHLCMRAGAPGRAHVSPRVGRWGRARAACEATRMHGRAG